MISKQDCLSLLTDINQANEEANIYIKKLISNNNIDTDILKFINDNRQLDLCIFYEKIRKSYNNKKSVLYKNIMQELNKSNVDEILTTLNSYALQACIFAKQCNDKQMFYRFSRLNEIYKCLNIYMQTFDLIPCIKLLNLIKADIKVLETIYRE